MFHLFANNVQCKHIVFGCCHDSSYRVALEKYISDPFMASKLTLLKSYETNTSFEGLVFDSVKFPRVFRSTPYRETDRFGEEADDIQGLIQHLGSDRTAMDVEGSSAETDKAIARWRATAAASTSMSSLARPSVKDHSSWAIDEGVLLNVNDERVDHELEGVDDETCKSMQDRISVQNFCRLYHLQQSPCQLRETCSFRHEPRLNGDELRFLKIYYRRKPCGLGSECRKPNCLYGHVCPHQPGCPYGSRCHLSRFHDVDKAAVKIWSPLERRTRY